MFPGTFIQRASPQGAAWASPVRLARERWKMMKLLEAKGINKRFYSTCALSDVDFDLEEGEVLGYGTHRELMESCQIYREIGRSQMEIG